MIDTAQKRFSMMNFGGTEALLFEPDSAVDGDDRAMLLGLYAGITLDGGGGGPAAGVSRDNMPAIRKQRRLAWRMRTLRK
jgi:hypothetical protein